MKRTFFLAASLVLSISTLSVNAQTTAYSITTANLTANTTGEENTRNTTVAGANTMVTESFAKKFPGVTNVKWTNTNNTTWGYFKQNGVPVRVSYNSKGKLLYTIRYYNENQVSPIIRQKLANEGYSMKIFHVTEITSRYSTTQVVKMEDEKSFLTVTINSAGEISVSEEFTKA